jgi:very-short-patch-repair endonuclease
MDGFLHTPLIDRQAGVVSRRQLLYLGATVDTIDSWVRKGRLIPMHRGVYAVGHRPQTLDGARWAAVLAGGMGTRLSHRGAGSVYEMCQPGSRVDVISPRQIRQDGIRCHRSRLHADDVTRREADGLPLTTPERTLIDLADVMNPRQLERAYDNARFNRTLSVDALTAALARADGRRGTGTLKQIIDADRPPAVPASEFERRLLDLIRANDLPEPVVNRRNHKDEEVDFCWPAHRLIVEADGGQHDRPAHSRKDKRRDALNLLDGWRTVRFAYRDLVEDPAYVVGVLKALLT